MGAQRCHSGLRPRNFIGSRICPAYYGRAWAKDWKKDYKGALQDAHKGYQLDPGNPGKYLRRIGSAFSGLNRYNEAIQAYSKAIEIKLPR